LKKSMTLLLCIVGRNLTLPMHSNVNVFVIRYTSYVLFSAGGITLLTLYMVRRSKRNAK